jgi:4-hydroxythreonine-4-phosphate dehydrogenase
MALPIIAITMGDPTGIGPEIIVKALSMVEPYQCCRPVVFGDRNVISTTIERLGLPDRAEVVENIPEGEFSPRRIFLFSLSRLEPTSLHFGKPDRPCAEAMVKYVEVAVSEVMKGNVEAITTCPINKQAMNAAGYHFSGHTELLAHLTGSPAVAMMFVGSRWNVVLVTTHLSLKEVPKWITRDRVLSTIRIAEAGLRKYFKVPHPRVAVTALNTHCGEKGLLGEEEEKAILPAISLAKEQGIEVEGPFPADSFFNLSRSHSFDVIVAMYHDQGLIPVKMADFREAVNLTLGLPFIRTSVGHGTAYDIAGKGSADPTNLVKAILTASKLSNLNRNC